MARWHGAFATPLYTCYVLLLLLMLPDPQCCAAHAAPKKSKATPFDRTLFLEKLPSAAVLIERVCFHGCTLCIDGRVSATLTTGRLRPAGTADKFPLSGIIEAHTEKLLLFFLAHAARLQLQYVLDANGMA